MQISRIWERSTLFHILRTGLQTPGVRAILEEYLGANDLRYCSFQELAKKHKMSVAEIDKLIENCQNRLLSANQQDAILDEVLEAVNEIIDHYKGPISIDTWIDEALAKHGWDQLTALRYLRFAELVQNRIKIDTDKMLFWDCNDRCRVCSPMRSKVEENHNSFFTDITEIQSVCEQINCQIKPNSKIDMGMVLFHDFGKTVKQTPVCNAHLFSAPRKYSEPEDEPMTQSPKPEPTQPKPIPIKAVEIPQSLQLSPQSRKILQYLLGREEGVSEARLVAHGKIIKADAILAITEINHIHYTKHKSELIESDPESGIWKVNIAHWNELANNTEDIELPDNTDEPTAVPVKAEVQCSKITQIENDEPVEKQKGKRSKSDVLVKVFEEALRNTRTSYKFYWAEALLYCAKNRLEEVSIRNMAAMMCVFAYKDVESGIYHYNHEDHIPVIIPKVRKSIKVKVSSFEQNVKNVEGQLSRNDVTRLTASVKDYFFPVMYRDKLVGIETEKREAVREAQKQNPDKFETYVSNSSGIQIQEDFSLNVESSYNKLRILIDKMKRDRLTKKRHCSLMR